MRGFQKGRESFISAAQSLDQRNNVGNIELSKMPSELIYFEVLL